VCSITVILPTKRKRFAESLPLTISVCRAGGARRPDCWNRHAAKASAALFSLFPGTMTGATNSFRIDWRQTSSCPSPRWERVSLQRFVSWLVLAAQGGLSFRLQHAEFLKRSERVRRDRTQSGPLRIFTVTPMPFAWIERASRWKQPRSNASHLQGRAGGSMLFVESPVGPTRPRCWTAISIGRPAARLAAAGKCKDARRFSANSMVVTSGLTIRTRTGTSAGRVSILQRSLVARPEARFVHQLLGSRDGGVRMFLDRSRIYGVAESRASGRRPRFPGARCDRAR